MVNNKYMVSILKDDMMWDSFISDININLEKEEVEKTLILFNNTRKFLNENTEKYDFEDNGFELYSTFELIKSVVQEFTDLISFYPIKNKIDNIKHIVSKHTPTSLTFVLDEIEVKTAENITPRFSYDTNLKFVLETNTQNYRSLSLKAKILGDIYNGIIQAVIENRSCDETNNIFFAKRGNKEYNEVLDLMLIKANISVFKDNKIGTNRLLCNSFTFFDNKIYDISNFKYIENIGFDINNIDKIDPSIFKIGTINNTTVYISNSISKNTFILSNNMINSMVYASYLPVLVLNNVNGQKNENIIYSQDYSGVVSPNNIAVIVIQS